MPKHRLVFFIGGFDPRSTRWYHRLYREVARSRPPSPQQEAVLVGERFRASAWVDAWDVQWQAPAAAPLHTRYAVLRWDDLVRQHATRDWRGRLKDHWHIYGLCVAQGVLTGLRRDAPAAGWMAWLPLGVALLTWAVAMVLAVGGLTLAALPGGWAMLVMLPLWLLIWRGAAERLNSDWLLRLYGFTWSQSCQRLPGLEERLDLLAQQVVAQVALDPPAEVLVVGHSSGSILAVAVLARALAQAPWLGERGPALGLLTLGHCTPMLDRMPAARRFRDELRQLADTAGLTWVDLSAPADWAAFAKTPPWRTAGHATMLQASPRFHAHLSATRYAGLLRHRDQLHLQYLRAPDLPGGYDLVGWTAGPDLLADRVASLAAQSAMS